jgi:hypothetical protein
LQGEEVDQAITMYKKAKMYDHMIRLVASHKKDNLPAMHMLVAQQLEAEVREEGGVQWCPATRNCEPSLPRLPACSRSGQWPCPDTLD